MEKYIAPEIEIVKFLVEDIITTSDGNGRDETTESGSGRGDELPDDEW